MDKLSISPLTKEFLNSLPWRIAGHNWKECFYHVNGKDGDREMSIFSINDGAHPIKEHKDRMRNNAEAIVSAVNNTYGQSINPEAVKDMFDVLTFLLEENEEDPNVPGRWLMRKMVDPAILNSAKIAIAKAKLILTI